MIVIEFYNTLPPLLLNKDVRVPPTAKALPLYLKIADRLRRQIQSGKLPHGTRLPGQRELAENFNTTLMTVRQALEILEEEQLIRTEHGVGMFVHNTNVQEDQFRLSGFSREMGERRLEVETRLLEVDFHHSCAEAANALGVLPNAELSLLARLRLMEELPLVYQRSFLPAWLQSAASDYTPTRSLYDQLQEECGQVVSMTREVLKPVCLTQENAAILETKPGDAAILSLRISYNPDGVPLVYDEALLSGSRFVITTERIGRRSSYTLNLLDRSVSNLLDLLQND
jgi:GntR family transcriptional regulator